MNPRFVYCWRNSVRAALKIQNTSANRRHRRHRARLIKSRIFLKLSAVRLASVSAVAVAAIIDITAKIDTERRRKFPPTKPKRTRHLQPPPAKPSRARAGVIPAPVRRASVIEGESGNQENRNRIEKDFFFFLTSWVPD